MYDMIWQSPFSTSCTIRSGGLFSSTLYDINLGATHTTILSTRGVQIPIYLVRSTTDSFKRCVVLFKPVRIPTSDPKSEFLCQSSHIAQNPADSPEPPRTPGIAPMPSSPRIIHTAIVQVLSLSTLSRSFMHNERSDLVVAFLLKSS